MIFFTAEAGSNHNQNFDRTMALIAIAARIGANAIKFQLFKAENLYVSIEKNIKKIEVTRSCELPPAWLPYIAEKCKKMGLKFGCTPFDLTAVDMIAPHVDFIKISSFDILRLDLIEACAKVGKPMMISTGLANPKERRAAYDLIIKYIYPKDLAMLHCVSKYPTKPEESCLGQIPALKELFKCKIGYSDHTAHPGVIYRAIMRGADVIEFHFDWEDGKGKEFGFGHCWLPYRITEVINNVRMGEAAEKYSIDTSPKSQRADPSDGLRPMMEAR